MPRIGLSAFEKHERESRLETKCVAASRAVGLHFMKMTSGGGIQDRLLFGESIAPAVVWVELKSKKGPTSEAQLEKLTDRRAEGYLAFIIDDYDQFLVVLDIAFNCYG